MSGCSCDVLLYTACGIVLIALNGLFIFFEQTQVGQHDTVRQQLEAKLVNETKLYEEVCAVNYTTILYVFI